MANFFEPGPYSDTAKTTPSEADQELKKFKLQLLMQILNSKGGNAPSFKSFVNGGPSTTPVPEGLGNLGEAALAMMGQPGAFTSTVERTGQGPTPSAFSDLAQMGLLGAMLYNSGALGSLVNGGVDAVKFLGGMLGLEKNPTGASSPPGTGMMESIGGIAPAIANQDNFFNGLGSIGTTDMGPVPLQSTADSQFSLLDSILNSGGYGY